MKINTLITLLAMTTLSLTNLGIVKAGCWIVLSVNFFAFAIFFDRRYEDERNA